MTCNIERPDPQVLFDRYRQLFENTVLGGATIIPESNEWYAVSVNYAMAEQFYAITEQAYRERDWRTACTDNLLAMAAEDGLYPREAVPAQGYVQLRGEPGAVLPETPTFTIDGEAFVVAEGSSAPAELDETGRAIVRVRAVTPGSMGNVIADEGTMAPVVVDVNETVCVCTGSFCNGTDAEEVEQFRQRYGRRLQYKPRATMEWMKDRFMDWPCVTRVVQRGGSCCQCSSCGGGGVGSASGGGEGCEECGCADCGGRMDFYVMFTGGGCDCQDLQNTQVLKEIEEWMFGSPQGYGLGQVEMGICGRVVPYQTVPVNVEVDIDDCANTVQITTINRVVAEFFSLAEPSQPMNGDTLRLSLVRVLGIQDLEVRLELANPSEGYGPSGQTDVDGPGAHVYVTPCGLEPDCDFLLTLNNVAVTRNLGEQTGGCP